MKKIIITSGLVAIASCVKLQGFIDMSGGLNTKMVPTVMQKPMFSSVSTVPQGSIKVMPQIMYQAQPMYTTTIPVQENIPTIQPFYTSTIPFQQNIPSGQPVIQAPEISFLQAQSIPSIPNIQPIIQTPIFQQPLMQPSVIQAPLPTQYYNPISIPQIPSINYAQQLYSQSGVQNLNNNMASTNSQNVAVNTSASGNSNANTSLTNNAFSTGTGQITIPTNGMV